MIQRLDGESVRLLGSTEVVVSPASVVKELTENALDSGATRITVRMEDFGLAQIEVSDNGCGIPADSMKMIGDRHCTSKASSMADLAEGKVNTYGFRGEALASIAAVAGHLSIATCCPAESSGRRYNFDHASQRFSSTPVVCAMQSGTTVAAAKLFDRLPVRRDYFTKNKTRCRDILSQCRQTVAALSLCRSTCRFSLKHGTTSLWESSAGLTVPTILALTAGPLVSAGDFQKVTSKLTSDGSFEMWLPSPQISVERQALLFRSSMDYFFISVNGRPIVDKEITSFVKRICSESGRFIKSGFPVAFLNLTLPRDSIDANVDVAKRQVFFGTGKESLLEALERVVLECLLQTLNAQHETAAATRRANSSRNGCNRDSNNELGENDAGYVNDERDKDSSSVASSNVSDEPVAKRSRREQPQSEETMIVTPKQFDVAKWSKGRVAADNNNSSFHQPVQLLMPQLTTAKTASSSALPKRNEGISNAIVSSRLFQKSSKDDDSINFDNSMADDDLVSDFVETPIGGRLALPAQQAAVETIFINPKVLHTVSSLSERLAESYRKRTPVKLLPVVASDELQHLVSCRPVEQVDVNAVSLLASLHKETSLLQATDSSATSSSGGEIKKLPPSLHVIGQALGSPAVGNLIIILNKTTLPEETIRDYKSSTACYANDTKTDDIKGSLSIYNICGVLIACSARRLAEMSLFTSMMASVLIPKRSLGHNFSLGRFLSSSQISFLASLPSKPTNPPLFTVITDNRIVANGFKIRVYSSSPLSSLRDPTIQPQQHPISSSGSSNSSCYCELEQALELPEPFDVSTPGEIGPVVAEVVEAMMAYPKDRTIQCCRPRIIVDYFRSEVDRLLTVKRHLSMLDDNNDGDKNNCHNKTTMVRNGQGAVAVKEMEILLQLLNSANSVDEMLAIQSTNNTRKKK